MKLVAAAQPMCQEAHVDKYLRDLSPSVAAATYGPLGELLTLDGQTYSYNSLLQLTRVQGAAMDIQYRYSATQNNGKILSQYDAVSGEEVTYTYDSLQRLSGAVTTTNPSVSQWGQGYTYDGWGNLTNIGVTKGSAPTLSVVADPATNRSSAYSYDANGNAGGGPYGAYTFDIENRLTTVVAAGLTYGYAADNKRIYKRTYIDQYNQDEEIYFYSVTGQKLGRYGLSVSGPSGQPLAVTVTFTQRETKAWFGGKLVGTKADRLGSIGKYYPYGDDKGSGNPANGTEKFATYTRDAETGLDYADQRYHAPGTGRFMSADPNSGSVRMMDPLSWNRYGYVGGDPANNNDPSGLVSSGDEEARDQYGCIVFGPPGSSMNGPGSCVLYSPFFVAAAQLIFEQKVDATNRHIGELLSYYGIPALGYDYDPASNTVDIAIPSSAFQAGAAIPVAVGAAGTVVIGGTPVGWVVVGGGVTVLVIGYRYLPAILDGLRELFARKADLAKYADYVRDYERQCGALTENQKDRLRREVERWKLDSVTREELIGIAKALFGCPEQEP